jgi:ligand-binding SRPBCC domain-containing protein
LHEFEEVEGGTIMVDRVDYAVPFGPLGEVARAIFVTRTVERIFDFRARTIAERFGATTAAA